MLAFGFAILAVLGSFWTIVWFIRSYVEPPRVMRPSPLALAARDSTPVSPPQTQRTDAAPDRTAALGKLTIPTTVIHGENDPLVPPANGRQTAAAPGARLIMVPGMGHALPE